MIQKQRIRMVLIATTALGLAAGASAQNTAPAPPPPARPPDAVYVQTGPAGVTFGAFRYVMAEGGFDRRLVTGAPFSAEAVTERIQTLADGNRIDQKTSAQIYRDSEGRTRREMKLDQIGPWGPQGGKGFSLISINDPVAGVRYVLNPQRQTAREFHVVSGETARLFDKQDRVMARGDLAPLAKPAGERQVAKEDLGQQTIEGIAANGTRETITIPVGAIGNEQVIKIVSERWYSPELQMDVMTRHDDPRFGETIYKLTNIDQGEPAATLFQVPANYTIVQAKGNVVMRYQDKAGSN